MLLVIIFGAFFIVALALFAISLCQVSGQADRDAEEEGFAQEEEGLAQPTAAEKSRTLNPETVDRTFSTASTAAHP
jgi:hypothetical protein